MIRLDGCVGCNKYVYGAGEKKLRHCPRVKSDGTLCLHPRFDENGQPHEVCVLIAIVFFNIGLFPPDFNCLCVESILFPP